tara:strand:+ start:683 stop:817 length:135 start_codon:yes stop_codon:yes gene_type:complete
MPKIAVEELLSLIFITTGYGQNPGKNGYLSNYPKKVLGLSTKLD